MNVSLRKWLKVAFLNLLVVSFLGCILRYKFAYSLPFVNLNFLLHGHSHFAFSGWVSQALMVLMIQYLGEKSGKSRFSRYRWILWANLIASYGMLLSFPVEGYGTVSIIFSSATVFSGYGFAILFWRDLNRSSWRGIEKSFFKASLFFNALSSLGPYALAFLMASKGAHPKLYEACIYFFLHFQYNGWFLFACMGLFAYRVPHFPKKESTFRLAFALFSLACVPAYLLSILWAPLPGWLDLLAALAGLAQLTGWALMAGGCLSYGISLNPSASYFARILFILCALAYSLKLILQAASAIPSLSHLTYGFRPIIIGYLHLVLLLVISLFILSYCIGYLYFPLTRTSKNGVVVFVAGILLNEILLMAQGIADLNYQSIPYMNQMLLAAAVIIFSGLFLINLRWKTEPSLLMDRRP